MPIAIAYVLLSALCLAWIAGAGLGLRVLRRVPALWLRSRSGTAPPLPPLPAPASPAVPVLSILVPASNEARSAQDIHELRVAHASRLVAAEALVRSGPGLRVELVYIDDRSSDATGAVLDEFAAGAAASPVPVRTLHVRTLPDGWLGKTHALQRALETIPTDARSAASSWILCTDADVRLGPDALRLALGHAHQQGLDHLVLTPQLEPGGLLRDATLGAFSRLFALTLASVNDPRSSASVGVGAFNLVRRAALDRIGGLRSVRLEVGDDMALGAALRGSGARQGVASGRELVQLAWYRDVGGIVRGLDKGIFAYGGHCRPWRLFAGATVLLVFELAPWVAMAVGLGRPAASAWSLTLGILGATAIALGMAIVAAGERWMGRRALPALFVPLGGLIMAWAVFRAGWMGWRRGGVLWRGTLYPSKLLREAMAEERAAISARKRGEGQRRR